MKAVVDRVVQYPHRYQLKNVNTGEILGTFDLEPITGTISVVGTKIDKALFDSIASDIADRLVSNGGDAKNNIVTYSMASSRSNVASGEKLSVSFGKIAKYFSDLKAVAFSGNKKDIGLGNVDNTSDANKPVSNATQQALNLKANASDVYSKTETDGLLNDKANKSDVYTKTKTDELLNNKANTNDVYSKTKTDELLNNKANKSDVYTKTETDNEINKPLYNLGYYDTMVENSDGTYTITRQTGYLNANNLIWSNDSSSGNYYRYYSYVDISTSGNSGSQTFISNIAKTSYIEPSKNGVDLQKTSDGKIFVGYVSTSEMNSAQINALNIQIQYKLATATTEKVEKNHYATYNQRFILEHNKSEAERSANLFDDNGTNSIQYIGHYFINSSYNLSSQNDYNCFRIRVEQNKTYYIKQIGELILRYEDINNNVLGGNANFYQSGYGSFTTPNGCKYVVFSKAISYTNNVMLNEGSTPLPYQPYEGKVVHEKELKSYRKNIYTTSLDANTIYYSSNYYGYGITNTPSSYGNLLTFQYTNKNDIPNFAIQLFLDQSSNEGNPNMYMRGSTSDAYTSWKRLAFVSDIPTFKTINGESIVGSGDLAITPGIFTKLGNKTNFSFDSGSYLVVANNGMVTVTGTDPLNVGSSANKKFVGIFMVTIAGYGGGQSVCVNTEEVFLGESASATISGPTFTIYKLN